MHGPQHFAGEALAVADGLRHVHSQIRFLVRAGDDRVPSRGDAWIILSHALKVAEALESLAQRLAPVEV